jgi:ribonuclease P protein component
LPAAARLHTARQFQRVYQRGHRATGQLITVVALRSKGGGGARLGVSVSKDHGAAVRRNKIKRLLREAFRLERRAFPSGLDVVLIPRRRDEKLLLADLRAELAQLVERIANDEGRPNRPRRGRSSGARQRKTADRRAGDQDTAGGDTGRSGSSNRRSGR